MERGVRAALSPDRELRTPTGRGKFRVSDIGPAGLVLLLGEKEARTPFQWAELESIVPFLKGRDWVELGGTYDVSAKPGTLDAHLKQFVNRATAGWVGVVLEESGIVEIDRDKPARIRLKENS